MSTGFIEDLILPLQPDIKREVLEGVVHLDLIVLQALGLSHLSLSTLERGFPHLMHRTSISSLPFVRVPQIFRLEKPQGHLSGSSSPIICFNLSSDLSIFFLLFFRGPQERFKRFGRRRGGQRIPYPGHDR